MTGAITVGSGPTSVAFSPDGSKAYVTNTDDRTVSVINVAAGTAGPAIAVGYSPFKVAFSPDGTLAYVANSGAATVSVINVADSSVGATITVGEFPAGVAFSPDGTEAYVTSAAANTVSVINVSGSAVTDTITVGKGPEDVAVSPDGTDAYVANVSDDSLSVLHVSPVSRLSGPDRFATSSAISAANFDPGVATVYIANGMNFPDALSAAPVGGQTGSPVLLVSTGSIPAAIQRELSRLQPGSIVVLGGSSSISDGVFEQLKGFTTGKVSRLSGPDRFATSAAISAASFASGVATVYIANGLNFPDALSAAPVGGKTGSPVLLVNPSSIPEPIQQELERLKPGRIVILGGVNSVIADVALQLVADTLGEVTRLSGADRFATSAEISKASFAAGVGTVYIANGYNFPDALSAAPVGGKTASPVLLVAPGSISEDIKAELVRLSPGRIVILGGPNSVSRSVAQQLTGYLK